MLAPYTLFRIGANRLNRKFTSVFKVSFIFVLFIYLEELQKQEFTLKCKTKEYPWRSRAHKNESVRMPSTDHLKGPSFPEVILFVIINLHGLNWITSMFAKMYLALLNFWILNRCYIRWNTSNSVRGVSLNVLPLSRIHKIKWVLFSWIAKSAMLSFIYSPV